MAACDWHWQFPGRQFKPGLIGATCRPVTASSAVTVLQDGQPDVAGGGPWPGAGFVGYPQIRGEP
jgi:hypothetical protein